MDMDGLTKDFESGYTDIDEDTSNKIKFQLNNCSNSNIDEKAAEFRKILKDERLIQFFGKHIVYRRVPTENNFHTLFIQLATKINKRELFQIMIKDSFLILNQMIDNDRYNNYIASQPENKKSKVEINKSNMKNLAVWVGLITLARNKPITIRDIDLKGILLEAYEN
mmetsp:Transcript_24297/g.21464  ORF Transcript_24297/g.21464 Transcript_24297/m.21464 type:complete len:167 (+) Transcript_24297:814-1314(+)